MRFSKGLVLALTLLLVAGVTATSFAQEQTGGIQGVVKDSSGAVLPGVTVEARNVTVAGVQSAVTDEKGVYRFPALPPGTYEVTATLQGFSPAKVGGATIVLGKLLTIDLALTVGGVSESVQVTGEAPLIDVKQNAGFATIQKDTIDRIPKGRDFQSVLKTAPGTQDESRSGGIQVDGASGSENRFVIDGMDTTSLQNGTAGKTMLLDFIQEVQVKSSGYNAEFGGATGGVVSAISKSGTNQIRGQAGTYYSSSNFYGEKRKFNRFDPFNSNLTNLNYQVPDADYTYWSPLVDMGGPILKDKLWYYAGYGYTKNSYAEQVTFYSDPNRVKRDFDWWSQNSYLNYNVTQQVTNNLRIKFSGSNDRSSNRKTAPGFQPIGYVFPDGTVANTNYTTGTFDKNADGSVNQAAYDSRWVKQGGNSQVDVYSGNVDWVVTPSFFVNASGGYYYANNTTPPDFRSSSIMHIFGQSNTDTYMAAQGYPTVPSQYQQVSGYTDATTSVGTDRNKYSRIFMNANTTFFKSWGGQHTFKVGMRFERLANDVLTGNTKPRVTLNWGQKYTNPDSGVSSTGTYGYYTLNQIATTGNVHSNNYSFWFQDSWSPSSRLTINAGVRLENELVPSYKDKTDFPDAVDIKFGFTDKLAPRLGFAYDLKGDGKWKAYGSFGYFYDMMKLALPRGSFGGDHWIDYNWSLDTADYATIQCGEGNTGCPGKFLGSTDFRHSSNQVDPLLEKYYGIPGMTGVDPGMKPSQSGEFTAGLDHELNPTMALKFRYVHKWIMHAIDDVGTFIDGNETYIIGNPGENLTKTMEPLYSGFPVPKAKRDYDSLEMRLQKRLSNNWSADVSYLWSRLYGNYSGSASSDESGGGSGRTDPNVSRYFDNTIQSYGSNGKEVLGALPTDRPHQLKVSGTYDFKWGTSLGVFYMLQSGSPQTTVIRFTGYPVFVYGRGDLGRSPTYSQTDLVATQEFRVGKSKRILLQANIDNLFDQSTWYGLYNVSSGYGPQKYRDSIVLSMPPAVLYNPSGYNVDSIVASYTGTLRANPLWKTPNLFQGRRGMRLQVKFTF